MKVFMSHVSKIVLSVLERAADKGVSRKFAAWAVATVGLFTSFISADAWVNITMLFVGAQAVLDLASTKAVANYTGQKTQP